MAKRKATQNKPEDNREVCGIVMPISERDGCSARHWGEVLEILTAAANAAGYEGNLVSNSEHIGVIHQTIVDNLFDNPVVVCDVSTENPNVMFELGLRLAFDKPTIVVVDDKTRIQFDTSPIEHLKYPRDLRFSNIVEFKEKLAEKIRATVDAYKTPEHKTFLKAFKRFTPAKLESSELPKSDLILQELAVMKQEMGNLRLVVAKHLIKVAPERSDAPVSPDAVFDENWVEKARLVYRRCRANIDSDDPTIARDRAIEIVSRSMSKRDPSVSRRIHDNIARKIISAIEREFS